MAAIPGFQSSPRDKTLQGFYHLKLYLFNFKMAPNPYSINSACLWYGPAWQTGCLADPLLSFFWSWCLVIRLRKLTQIHQEYHKVCVCLNLYCFSCFSEPTLPPVPLKARRLTANHKGETQATDPQVEEKENPSKRDKK